MKILVVDDVPDNVKLLAYSLEDDGYEVIQADNGEKAIALCESENPDLVLLDINMPGMSGLEVCAILKKEKKLPVPIILVSANEMEDTIVEGLDNGADDYVSKPFNYNILAARMRTSLRLKQSQDQLKHLYDELLEKNHRLEILATTDSLTNLLNRSQFFHLSEQSLASASRYGRKCSFLMIDIDYFKKVNDTYGHDAGDKVLVMIADKMTEAFRASDILSRLGGEEFAICLPETDTEQALLVAERMRAMIEGTEVLVDHANVSVTVSIGIAEFNRHGASVSDLLKVADTALYGAKNSGRNKIVVAK